MLNYNFKESCIYFIKFSINNSDTKGDLSLSLTNITQQADFVTNQQSNEEVKTFSIPSGLYNFSTIFSPFYQSYNTLAFLSNNIFQLLNVEIYEVANIQFFEGEDNNQIKIITKIGVQGTPGTHLAINGFDLQIGESRLFEVPYNTPIYTFGVASNDKFIVDLTYKTLEY